LLRDGKVGLEHLMRQQRPSVRHLTGDEVVHEIVGKPHDLDEIVGAVKQAIGRSAL
jgi:hypothetical protein